MACSLRGLEFAGTRRYYCWLLNVVLVSGPCIFVVICFGCYCCSVGMGLSLVAPRVNICTPRVNIFTRTP